MLDPQQQFGCPSRTPVAQQEVAAGTRAADANRENRGAHRAHDDGGGNGRVAFTLDNSQVWNPIGAAGRVAGQTRRWGDDFPRPSGRILLDAAEIRARLQGLTAALSRARGGLRARFPQPRVAPAAVRALPRSPPPVQRGTVEGLAYLHRAFCLDGRRIRWNSRHVASKGRSTGEQPPRRRLSCVTTSS